jgi:hypothetical protein
MTRWFMLNRYRLCSSVEQPWKQQREEPRLLKLMLILLRLLSLQQASVTLELGLQKMQQEWCVIRYCHGMLWVSDHQLMKALLNCQRELEAQAAERVHRDSVEGTNEAHHPPLKINKEF